VRELDHLKISYEMDSHPTQEVLNYFGKNLPAQNIQRQVIDMFSRHRTAIDIMRKGSQWKYQVKSDLAPLEIESNAKGAGAFGQPKIDEDIVEVHSRAGFFYLDNLEHSGAFRPEWPQSPENPLSFVMTPADANLIAQLQVRENLIEVRDKSGKSLTKYHLDPQFSMMPTEIEYFDVQENGSLFLYRVVKVEKYLQTKQGAYIPETGAIYDFASKENEHLTWQVEERFKLVKSEIGVDIPDSEFELKFPAGTHVTDYTIDINYLIPKNGKNPVFSILNSQAVDPQMTPE
jgi:hypothetical protein